MLVILGLGNPGPRYEGTRHNIGIPVIERLAERWGVPLADRKDTHVGGKGAWAGREVYLAASRTYMNLSGDAVRALSNKMGRQTANLVVVHDDIDLPLGCVRLKDRGGDGGHRGIRSVIQALGSGEFIRVRAGVGRPAEIQEVADFVLERFPPGDRDLVQQMIEAAADAIEALLAEGFILAQTRIHAKR